MNGLSGKLDLYSDDKQMKRASTEEGFCRANSASYPYDFHPVWCKGNSRKNCQMKSSFESQPHAYFQNCDHVCGSFSLFNFGSSV